MDTDRVTVLGSSLAAVSIGGIRGGSRRRSRLYETRFFVFGRKIDEISPKGISGRFISVLISVHQWFILLFFQNHVFHKNLIRPLRLRRFITNVNIIQIETTIKQRNPHANQTLH